MKNVPMCFYSQALGREAVLDVLLPDAESPQPLRTLYLLHGAGCSPEDFYLYTPILPLAEQYQLAVVIPRCENSYYRDVPNGCHWFDFVSREIIQQVADRLPVSQKPEDTFIGGISMGGYGALRCGLLASSRFGKVFSISGALRIDLGLRYMKNCGIDVTHLRTLLLTEFSDKNELLTQMKTQLDPTCSVPRTLVMCGAQDLFFPCNLEFVQAAQALRLPVQWKTCPGDHHWSFWADALQHCIAWLMEDSL